MGNVFTDTGGVIARQGMHTATIVATKHIGKQKTKYGMKDMQQFVLRVSQFSDTGAKETAEIHQQYHRSFDPKASLVKFLAALGIEAHRGMTVDFEDLVGRTLQIVVDHTPPDANGIVHANVTPLRRRGTQ